MSQLTSHIEQVAIEDLVKTYGTPLYVYSKASITEAFKRYQDAFGARKHLICYAVKANSNLSVIRLLADLGAGFDIVSRGELLRVLKAGGDPTKVIFSGVGKTREDLRFALETGIHCFNVESEAELYRLNEEAGKLGLMAPISFRVNPDVDAKTHPYISTGLRENKFGIPYDQAVRLYEAAHQLSHIAIKGIDCHIGSQLTELSPYCDAVDRMLKLIDALKEKGIELEHFDMGGGLGIDYQGETLITPQTLVDMIYDKLGDRDLMMTMEPGRSIVGDSGYLLTEVILTKENEGKHFAVVDAAMNDLIRPALYESWMRIETTQASDAPVHNYDIVGPVCETGDFLGKNRDLALSAGDILVVKQAGAYGFVMSSNYNTRGRAAEILIDQDQAYLIRERERLEDLFANEKVVSFDER
ncbi:diaminopimelate decarboxylase [Wohlfahrtiimonas chitiniclastica]|uniref:Diaminopimelate decarboxylase n=1 Tax=Wohlfahrtiimonas chitiniclastica TaxID=400946 RepID=A0AB35C1Z5_9GAMM|nr:diaminopimelate decarboxylase [Wohlfahrtiimonas chitiniclastica]MBS7825398.1 diaminopimelate decarboxylase [Wohlfahrtiimonas chitiniclastica]MBS7841018.1 diaminopimelate decarboxylase [Wohlfahrtiimonas chitiniclastica]